MPSSLSLQIDSAVNALVIEAMRNRVSAETARFVSTSWNRVHPDAHQFALALCPHSGRGASR